MNIIYSYLNKINWNFGRTFDRRYIEIILLQKLE